MAEGRSAMQSLAASPTMVGAITTLIVIVAVFLAYNANQGLPFVPTYRISVEMPNAARLGPNNEVRIGGNRIGVVESFDTVVDESSGKTAAKLNLKLDKTAEPIPEDTIVKVRYRSSFGLKYLELERGDGPGLPQGGTLPLSQAQEQVEFDDIGSTFDHDTREGSRKALEGFGTGFAARGASLNQAIEALAPLFDNLKPVAEALASPQANIERFFFELADAAREVAPLAEENAELFAFMAVTFGAISRDPDALRETISEGPPTLETGIRSLAAQRPFLRDFAEASRRLRPGVRALRRALPTLNRAIEIGTPVLRRTPTMNRDLRGVMVALERLVDNPSTKISLIRLQQLFDEVQPAAEFIVPYQTVCNYWNYWFTFLTEHITQRDSVGYSQRVSILGVPGLFESEAFPMNPLDNYSGLQANGRYSMFQPRSRAFAGKFDPVHQPILHGNPYGPAVTNGEPDCQSGQTGYAVGEFLAPGQHHSNPTFGAPNIPTALGKTDLFLRKDGTRVFTGE